MKSLLTAFQVGIIIFFSFLLLHVLFTKVGSFVDLLRFFGGIAFAVVLMAFVVGGTRNILK